jgi:hypothetical protein
LRVKHLILPSLAVIVLSGAPSVLARGGGSRAVVKTMATGGVGLGAPATPISTPAHPIVVGTVAKIINGIAYAPAYAPIQVQRAIWAGNAIRHKPYIYGGGHGSFTDSGYDCSGSVSYVLHGAGLLSTPFDSSGFMSWGQRGLGRWMTVYTNPSHAFVQIAGIRFDTSAMDDPNPAPGSGPRWRPAVSHAPGFTARHPAGF